MNIQLNQTKPQLEPKGFALWQLGFRPCFMFASLYAVVSMVLWLLVQQGWYFPGLNHYTINFWHAHEMIFAYGLLVIGGFLLTAIKNWTGVQTIQGKGLMLLVGSWLVSRVAVFIPGVSPVLLAVIDMIYPLLLIIYIAKPLIAVGNKRNYVMIAMVSTLALLNAGFHWAVISGKLVLASQLLLLALMLVLLLISLMAGRIFAMFSQNGVEQRYQAKLFPKIELLLPFTMILLAVSWVFFAQYKWLLCVVSILNVVLHGVRLYGWYNVQIWQKPLVWVLHVGYGFLVLGFAFVVVSAFVPAIKFLAIHVFTVGAFGLITLGMMARVSYGHTGRNLHQPPKILGFCFALLVLSTLLRVLIPLFNVIPYSQLILISGLFWAVAFGAFACRYLPIWIKPRIDGKPG